MGPQDFSELEKLPGRRVLMTERGSYVPQGTVGTVSQATRAPDGSYILVVNWEPNPMFPLPVPRSVQYSSKDLAKSIRLVD